MTSTPRPAPGLPLPSFYATSTRPPSSPKGLHPPHVLGPLDLTDLHADEFPSSSRSLMEINHGTRAELVIVNIFLVLFLFLVQLQWALPEARG